MSTAADPCALWRLWARGWYQTDRRYCLLGTDRRYCLLGTESVAGPTNRAGRSLLASHDHIRADFAHALGLRLARQGVRQHVSQKVCDLRPGVNAILDAGRGDGA